MKFPEFILERLQNLPLRAKIWWGAGIVLLLGTWVTSTDSCLGVLTILALVAWALPTLFWAFYWVWRRVTYRIGVRLFLSYLLIGVLPFPLILALLVFASYVLIGQYASSGFGDVLSRVENGLEQVAQNAVEVASYRGSAAAVEVLNRGPSWPESVPIEDQVVWLFNGVGEKPLQSLDADLPMPEWVDSEVLEGDLEVGSFWHGEYGMLAAVAHRDGRVVVVAIRLTPEVGKRLSAGQWYTVQFSSENGEDEDGEDEDGEDEDGEGDSDDLVSEDGGFWHGLWTKRWIRFIRLGPDARLWKDGKILDDDNSTTFIRTSPNEAASHLFRVPADFRQALWAVFLIACAVFLTIYLGAVSLAVYYILVITRATARLTTGARQVQAGHLDHRIPVKRRDQLGDLAIAFNQMTESVAGMLGEVAEKERLKNELELAREIQQSLLPKHELRHGSIVVHAHFQSAAEVGGDYFDLFPLERGHLIVAVGDVAGHGLPTGLLMAMIKSAVATLIQEGHRGVTILERVNHFMLQQPRQHRMVTLAIAEINVETGIAEITNAAHPPVYLSGGSVREVLLPALPVGYKWPEPPPTERLELSSGSRLIFYSDGLVEAINDNEEPFGYDRLKELLEEHVELESEALLARILEDLASHTEGRPLDDDLTVLVIDCGVDQPNQTQG